MRKIWIWVSVFLFPITISGANLEQKSVLNPYQDYIIVLIHGLNDYNRSMIGTNEEWSVEQRKLRDIRQNLTDDLGIPKYHIVAYSYLMNRGSNVENARQLGERGYTPSMPSTGIDVNNSSGGCGC